MLTIRTLAPLGVHQWSHVVPVRLDDGARASRAPVIAVAALAVIAAALAAVLASG